MWGNIALIVIVFRVAECLWLASRRRCRFEFFQTISYTSFHLASCVCVYKNKYSRSIEAVLCVWGSPNTNLKQKKRNHFTESVKLMGPFVKFCSWMWQPVNKSSYKIRFSFSLFKQVWFLLCYSLPQVMDTSIRFLQSLLHYFLFYFCGGSFKLNEVIRILRWNNQL